MSSLTDQLKRLESDLLADPPRISAYRDLPFAILRYEPDEEWELRRQVGLLATRLTATGREVVRISLADLLWEAIAECEGIASIATLERDRGYARAERQVTTYLTDPDWAPLPDLLARRLAGLDPARQVAFLTRAGALAPGIYHMSKLLDEMQGRTEVPAILFYPGRVEGLSGLHFMNVKGYETTGNYRVKIYD